MIRRYLEGIVDDRNASGSKKPVAVLHSDRHGALLAHLRVRDGDASDGDRALLREAAVLDARAAARLSRATDLLNSRGIDCLVLKGAAFSAVYPDPHLRPRNDDDLWVRTSQFPSAAAALQAGGYHAENEITSSEITRQRHLVTLDESGRHDIDLHWWPVNPSAFDALPSFDECFERSVRLTAVDDHVRTPAPVYALILACAHRVAHHTETEDAMWHCDLHFLARSLAPGDWPAFELLARRARIARIAGVQLQYVNTMIGTDVPRDVVERLLAVEGESSVQYLRPLGPLRNLWLELRARPSLVSRIRLLLHHLIPPRAYVAARYGYEGLALLPLLYAHRVVHGFAQWTAEFVARAAR